jgi:hypothetical protein
MNIRTQIRNAFTNKLLGLPTTGNNVFTNIVYALEEENLPAIVIITEGESFSYEHPMYPRIETRTMEVKISGLVKQVDNYQDTIDQVILEVEDKLGEIDFRTCNGLVQWHEKRDLLIDFNGNQEEPIAEFMLTYEVKYRVQENNHTINV